MHWSKERASAGGDLRYDINVIPIPQLLKSNILMVARRLLDVKSVDIRHILYVQTSEKYQPVSVFLYCTSISPDRR